MRFGAPTRPIPSIVDIALKTTSREFFALVLHRAGMNLDRQEVCRHLGAPNDGQSGALSMIEGALMQPGSLNADLIRWLIIDVGIRIYPDDLSRCSWDKQDRDILSTYGFWYDFEAKRSGLVQVLATVTLCVQHQNSYLGEKAA